jgi:hypothetical protein
VTLGDLENNIKTWAKSLPLNNFIVSMVDKQAMTQSEKHGTFENIFCTFTFDRR